jgi:hypothetical protein
MRARFVPSYYARDLIKKLQQLKQDARSVEEYYQELQIGMLRYNLEEREDAAMAQFFVGLNRKIQDILEYKDDTNITHLFYFACKAKKEMQGHHASLELLPQIQHLGRPQQQRVPHHPPSLLHLQAEREISNVTTAKGLDMLCVIVPPSMFWS